MYIILIIQVTIPGVYNPPPPEGPREMSQSSVMDNGAKDSRAHQCLGKNRRERIVLPSYL